MPKKEDYWRNPEKYRAAANQYRLKHPEWHREATREWAAEWRAKNPIKAQATAQRFRDNMSDEQKAAKAQYAREWRARNPNYSKEYQRKMRVKDPLRTILNQAKIRARNLGLPFNLTRDNVVVPTVCPVFGTLLDYQATGVFNPNSPSIDRLVPSLGYVDHNCRIISNRANILKRDGTLEELEAVVAYMRRELG